jgi:exopolysaccharide biosynthesis protein
MNKTQKFLCAAVALALLLVLPFSLPSGAMPDDVKTRLLEEVWDEDEGEDMFGRLFPSVSAAELPLEPLPIDFTPGRLPNKEAFIENGYTDASISLQLETREEEGVVWRLAFVQISHPSQLRTATAGSLQSSRVAKISAMAEKNNAIIAMNANYIANNPTKTSFEYRMGEKIRSKNNNVKDMLIIDENGDMNLFVGKDKPDQIAAFLAEGHQIINAFTFGPALVSDGVLLSIPKDYGYNPNGKEPRIALGQLDALSYVIVLAEGRTQDSQGVTQHELAEFMYNLGCMQAFNFDGGNSATLVYNGGYYQHKSESNERAQSDMIYFATLIDHEK